MNSHERIDVVAETIEINIKASYFNSWFCNVCYNLIFDHFYFYFYFLLLFYLLKMIKNDDDDDKKIIIVKWDKWRMN
jgi:hypothetical protein